MQDLAYDVEARINLIDQEPIREGSGGMRVDEIHERVGRGEYRVDAHAVAEAIMRRLAQAYGTPSGDSGAARAE